MKNQARLVETTQVEVIPNNLRNISTNCGNYTETVGRDSIGRDSITKNVKNITIGNKNVEINQMY